MGVQVPDVLNEVRSEPGQAFEGRVPKHTQTSPLQVRLHTQAFESVVNLRKGVRDVVDGPSVLHQVADASIDVGVAACQPDECVRRLGNVDETTLLDWNDNVAKKRWPAVRHEVNFAAMASFCSAVDCSAVVCPAVVVIERSPCGMCFSVVTFRSSA